MMTERILLRMNNASKVISCEINKEMKIQRDRHSERKKMRTKN